MVLQGLEAFFNGEHVNVLSAGRRYKGIDDARPQGHRSAVVDAREHDPEDARR